MTNLINLLFTYSEVKRFQSNSSSDIAARKLKDIMSNQKRDSSTSVILQSRLGGKITENEVILHRVIPALGNYLIKPIFYGKFVTSEESVLLEGRFTVSGFFKICFWVAGFLLLVLELMLISSAIASEVPMLRKLLIVLFVPISYCLTIAVILFFKWSFKGDVKWISDRITDAFK